MTAEAAANKLEASQYDASSPVKRCCRYLREGVCHDVQPDEALTGIRDASHAQEISCTQDALTCASCEADLLVIYCLVHCVHLLLTFEDRYSSTVQLIYCALLLSYHV